jgi:hypothetical protein
MRALALAALLAAPAAASDSKVEPSARCANGLDRALVEMKARPLMKEEMATGLMWLRLDAQQALERGDAAACLEHLAAVEEVLGIDASSDD